MSRTRKFLIVAGGVIASPLVLVVLWIGYALVHGTVLQLMGYPVDVPPYELAEQIAAEGGDPLRCRKLQQSVPTMGPSLAEKRMSCFYHIAKLTKDPEVCELLMPSEYGWSCLGEVAGKLFSGRLCTTSGSIDHRSVYCNRESEGEITIDRPQTENCALYTRKDLQEWCFDTRTQYIDDIHECDRITRDVVRDHCEYGYALKQRDPSLCATITDQRRREYCTFRVNAALEYRSS